MPRTIRRAALAPLLWPHRVHCEYTFAPLSCSNSPFHQQHYPRKSDHASLFHGVRCNCGDGGVDCGGCDGGSGCCCGGFGCCGGFCLFSLQLRQLTKCVSNSQGQTAFHHSSQPPRPASLFISVLLLPSVSVRSCETTLSWLPSARRLLTRCLLVHHCLWPQD